MLATFAMAGYYLIRLRGILNLSFVRCFPRVSSCVNLLISAIAGRPVALLLVLGLHGFLQLVVAAVVYVPCYVALLFVAKRLDQTEIEFGRRVLGNTVCAHCSDTCGHA